VSDQTYIEPVVKSQPIRLLDMFIIGPLMIAGAVATRRSVPLVAYPLALFGVTTIVYNALNYTKVRDLERSGVSNG
jgi:hypothetical protein